MGIINEKQSSKNSMTDQEENQKSWPKRLIWFIILWAGGITALGTITFLLRMFFNHAYS